MASNGTDLLPGQSPPLTIITSTNQSGIVLIATALGLIFALISILIRVFIRFEFRTEFARDDIVAAVSMVSLCLYQVRHKWQLMIDRYLQCFNPVSYLLKSPKVSARPFRISLRSILCNYRRSVSTLEINDITSRLTGACTGLLCERYSLYHYPLAHEMLCCIPVSTTFTKQRSQPDIVCNIGCFDSVDGHIRVYCRFAL